MLDNTIHQTEAISKPRHHYIDIAKGILIFMVIYNHIGNLASASGIKNEVTELIPSTRFFSPFFMPAFFIIAGICSNYTKTFKDFLVSNAKALLIPAVTLLIVRILIRYLLTGTFSYLEYDGLTSKELILHLGYWNWFLTALFTSKVIFYVVLRYCNSRLFRLLFFLFLHITGVIIYNNMSDLFSNIFFYQHALMFVLYIEIGIELKNNKINFDNVLVNGLVFMSIYILYIIIGRTIPRITSDPTLPIVDVLPHLMMSICGSLFLLNISRRIGQCSFIEEFGKHSLVIYCLHFQFMFSFYQIFKESLNTMGTRWTIVALLIMFVFTSYGCLLMSKLLNTRYLRFVIGKF